MRTTRISLLAVATVLAACADASGTNLSAADASANRSASASAVGGVFTQTNDATGNAVVAYTRGADGSLSHLGTYSTGGLGTAPASGLGRFAYTANAGSGSISGYAVDAQGSLKLITPDGATGITGTRSTPLDMDVSRNSRFLYVIEGGTGNIMGFAIGRDGSLSPMADMPPQALARPRGGLAAY